MPAPFFSAALTALWGVTGPLQTFEIVAGLNLGDWARGVQESVASFLAEKNSLLYLGIGAAICAFIHLLYPLYIFYPSHGLFDYIAQVAGGFVLLAGIAAVIGDKPLLAAEDRSPMIELPSVSFDVDDWWRSITASSSDECRSAPPRTTTSTSRPTASKPSTNRSAAVSWKTGGDHVSIEIDDKTVIYLIVPNTVRRFHRYRGQLVGIPITIEIFNNSYDKVPYIRTVLESCPHVAVTAPSGRVIYDDTAGFSGDLQPAESIRNDLTLTAKRLTGPGRYKVSLSLRGKRSDT